MVITAVISIRYNGILALSNEKYYGMAEVFHSFHLTICIYLQPVITNLILLNKEPACQYTFLSFKY